MRTLFLATLAILFLDGCYKSCGRPKLAVVWSCKAVPTEDCDFSNGSVCEVSIDDCTPAGRVLQVCTDG
jgi:hypothetical protein